MKYCTIEMEHAYSELATIGNEFTSCVLKNDWYNAIQSMWEFIDTLEFHKEQIPEEDVKRKSEWQLTFFMKLLLNIGKNPVQRSSAFFRIIPKTNRISTILTL